MINRQQEDQNEYAKDGQGDIKFILDVVSGRKGYWCLGCGKEMQAVKFKAEHFKSYFRHDPKDVKFDYKCTFSNQNARNLLAMDILGRTKRIKLPNLYKFSPDSTSKILIRESAYIEAHSVRAELSFYENVEGEILWEKDPDIDSHCLLIKPNVTFFDIQGKPILLIEIVTSNKINDERRVNLKRLGIDTIQITLPKDSPENIAKSLEISQRTKWVYSHVEQNTTYLQLSSRDRQAVSATDDIEMGFFRETFACRESQIKNLIRSITRCLESQQYRRTEQELRSELSRVEGNASRDFARLEGMRNEHRGRVEGRYSKKIAAIAENERQFNVDFGATEAEVNRKERELEQRYLAEKGRIEDRRRELAEFGEQCGNVAGAQRALDGESKAIREKISNVEGRIADTVGDRERVPAKFEKLHRQEQSRFEILRRGIAEEEKNLPNQFDEGKRRLEAKFEADRERAIEIIAYRDCGGDSELSEGIKRIFTARGIIDDIEEAQLAYSRSRKAYDCYMDGTYKNWFGR